MRSRDRGWNYVQVDRLRSSLPPMSLVATRWQRGRVWRIASEQQRSVPRQRDAEGSGHLTIAREGPAGIRHAVAQAVTTTECGLPLPTLRVWDIVWPGDRGAVVCTACAIAVVRATESG